MNLEKEFKKRTGLEFIDFYNDYRPKLKWYISKYTKDLNTAEDFVQDAFIQGLNKIETFEKEKSQIQTWLTTIARNLVIKEFNDNKKNPKISIDKDLNQDDENGTSLLSFLKTDDEILKEKEEKEIEAKYKLVFNSIQNLPEKYKKIMIMREIDKVPYKEIADTLNRNLSTIKSQIRKGRQLIIDDVEKKFNYIDNNGVQKY
jgi:RNA polymerase sigma-70 factor (ECF subfamily)